MAKHPTQTSRKCRFELLEDRRLLTAWNVEAKFNSNTATNAGSGNPNPTNDGGEAAFGDSATRTAAQLGHSTNNNYGDAVSATYHWTPGATDNATSSSPWTFGDLSSGPTAFNATTPYTYSGYVDPTTFDNYLTGSAGGGAGDGVSQSVPGLAGFSRGDTAIFYNYGNAGLNGDGAGEAVVNPFDSYATIPTGTLLLSSLGAAPSAQFTAPSTGYYSFGFTFTDPYFDPFNGPGGGNSSNEAWAWDTGQGQFLIYKIASGTPTLLASGFPEDIAAVTTVPTVGNTVDASSGLSINSGTVLGSTLNSETPYSANYPTSGYANTGLPLVSLGAGGTMGNPNATQQTNTYAYGSGGTWALTNVGTILSSPAQDTTGDEYDMKWTVTTTVSLSAGDKIQLDDNPEWMQGSAAGDYYAPVYLNASVVPGEPPLGHVSVTTSGSTGQTFTLGGSAVAVDSGITVTCSDTDITGATMQITTDYQTGDSLNFTNQNGITGTYSAGLLTLSGSATPAQYTAALQSVTFSTTSVNMATRTISVIADDSNESPTTSNTGIDTVHVAIAHVLLNANQASKADTAGQTVTVDSAVTLSSFDTDVTGATMTISAGTLQSGDTLHFTNQNGITGVYSGGVMTLSGSATPAQYQTALQSITYSTTSTSTLTRNISMVVSDSNDTGNVPSNTATTQIVVSAPIAISQLYVNGTAWSAMDSYMGLHSEGSATLGYALLTGASQVKPLPWSSINKIDVQFSGALGATPSASSFAIIGGTGGAGHAALAPSVTSVTSLGGNAYALTLSASLGYNNYVISIASSSTVFGPAVTDANGAGISGVWTNSSSTFPSGNGLAGSQFNFQIDVLPGDTNQNGTVNSQDTAKTSLLANDKTTGATSASYSPFVDVNGNGTINSQDGAVATTNVNLKTSNITNPTNPSGGLAGGSGFTALALGVQESGQTSGSSTPAVSNVSSPSVAPATTTTVTTSSTGSGSAGSSSGSTSSSHNHGRHAFAATDAAVSDFDLADLWA